MVAWIALALLAATVGCRICSSPYDYCGPTFTGECGEECCSNARAGSIFSGQMMAPFPDDGYLLDDGYVPSGEFSLNDEVDPDVVVQVDSEVIDEISSDAIDIADSRMDEETDPDAIDEIDSGVVLSAAEEELEASPEDELPLLKAPQVAKRSGMLPSDGWKAVKRTKGYRR